MSSSLHGKAVTRNLFPKLFSPIFSFLYFPVPFPFILFTYAPKWPLSPLNPVKGFGETLVAPITGENDIRSHETHPMGSK